MVWICLEAFSRKGGRMKIDGIKLLEKIKNKEIKEGTKINCSRFNYDCVHIVYEGGRLNLYESNGERYDEDKWSGVITAEDLLNYTFEILEEDKEIEELNISERRKRIDCYPLTVEIMAKINELIKEVKKIKKEGK